MSTGRPPLPVEALVSDDARREADAALDVATAAKKPVTVKEHEAFRQTITARPVPAVDPIDELVEELRTASRP